MPAEKSSVAPSAICQTPVWSVAAKVFWNESWPELEVTVSSLSIGVETTRVPFETSAPLGELTCSAGGVEAAAAADAGVCPTSSRSS